MSYPWPPNAPHTFWSKNCSRPAKRAEQSRSNCFKKGKTWPGHLTEPTETGWELPKRSALFILWVILKACCFTPMNFNIYGGWRKRGGGKKHGLVCFGMEAVCYVFPFAWPDGVQYATFLEGQMQTPPTPPPSTPTQPILPKHPPGCGGMPLGATSGPKAAPPLYFRLLLRQHGAKYQPTIRG